MIAYIYKPLSLFLLFLLLQLAFLYSSKRQRGVKLGTYHLFIDLLGPPTIINVSDNQTAIEGYKVILNCTADGNPPPNITWTRLSNNSRVTFPLAVRRRDEGGYRCTADNGIAIKVHDVFITVQCE